MGEVGRDMSSMSNMSNMSSYGGGQTQNMNMGANMNMGNVMGPGQGGEGQASGGPVIMVYGLDSRMNCERLFNLFCMYGNVAKVLMQ